MSTALVLGHPVARSLSPAMHNAAFAALGLPHHYEVRDVAPDGLAAAIERLRDEDVLGANVTIPHKERAMTLVDGVSDEAARIGALNTIVRRGSSLVGENTDRYGFERSLADSGSATAGPLLGMERVLVLGAGGAARAVVLALVEHGARVRLASRGRERAEAVGRALAPYASGGGAIEIADWPAAGADLEVDGVVNATPLGMSGEDPLAGIALPGVVVDIVPSARETPLVRRAREAHHVTVVEGLPMLLHQAARSFELWTGLPAPLEAMRAALPRPA